MPCSRITIQEPGENEPGGKIDGEQGPSPDVSDLLPADGVEQVWDEYASKQLLKQFGIPVVEERIVSSATETEEAAVALGFPVVLKGLLPGQVHKTESGLVRLGIATSAGLRDAFAGLRGLMKGSGRIVIQRQMEIDYELIAGFLRDDQFGPCVMFGLGGIFSELEKDVVFALAPLSRDDAKALIRRIRGRKLLEGFRGMEPLDEKAMADILVALGNLGTSCDQIGQIDINPLAVSGGGCPQPLTLQLLL